MTRTQHSRACALTILFVLAAAPIFAQSGSAVGRVEYLIGEVRINGSLVDFGYEVQIGDWVETGPAATVDIVFDRVNVISLDENTVAQLHLGTRRQEVDLRFGSMSAVFDRVRTLAGNGGFNVRTPTSVGGVRGTSFFIKVVDSDTSYVCTCNGTVTWGPEGPGENFASSAEEHEAFYFRKTPGGGVAVEDADLKYHSNESMDEVAERHGLVVPWGRIE